MNLSLWRKLLAAFFLCFFGALAAAAELILGALLPVFFLEYAGLNPSLLAPLSSSGGGLPEGIDPIKSLASLPGAPPIWRVQLLASMPVLVMGLANLALVPLAISVGRRPVLLLSGVIAIAGAFWAGHSHSLESHIAARCVQAIGAGTVESLIPFILQDMVFVSGASSHARVCCISNASIRYTNATPGSLLSLLRKALSSSPSALPHPTLWSASVGDGSTSSRAFSADSSSSAFTFSSQRRNGTAPELK